MLTHTPFLHLSASGEFQDWFAVSQEFMKSSLILQLPR